MRQRTQWHSGLNDSVLSACTHTNTHVHTCVHTNTPREQAAWVEKKKQTKKTTAAGKPWAGRGRGSGAFICPDVFDLSFLLNVTDLVQFHMPTLHRCQRAQEERLKMKKSSRNQRGCGGTCCTIRSIFSSHSQQKKQTNKQTGKTSLINHNRISQLDSEGGCRF